MEAHRHAWDKAAALMMLDADREHFASTAFLERILGREKHVIADIGCGPGFFASRLERFASMLYCIDDSKHMLSAARKLVHGSNVRFLKDDSSDISLPDSSVDVVFMANSFHDMDRARTGAEVLRILKPEGRIIIIDWKKGARTNAKAHHGPPNSLRMSESEYLAWLPGFRVVMRFRPGAGHFGMVLAKA